MDAKHGKKVSFSTKVVVASAIANVAFTIAVFVLAVFNILNKTNVMIPTELIVAWFAFWTVELVSLASIKKDKIRNKYHEDEA